jgi:oligopeptide/dipeptide ABC transporter ATP-binding protein
MRHMPQVRADGLTKTFRRSRSETVHAVNDVSFTIAAGETLALIGESGSGKSTVGRLLLRLLEADAGEIEVNGRDVRSLSKPELRAARAKMQIVFQEPYESLNPRMRVGDIVAEHLRIHEPKLTAADRKDRVLRSLAEVGLDTDQANRYPRSLSGGQQQRVGIARALVTQPSFLVLDEPTSSLDLSVQAQILEILGRLQTDHGMSYLYISHDLSTVNYIAQRVAVMYLGQIRELGTVEQVVDNSADPYTHGLLGAFLDADPRVRREAAPAIYGEIPSPTDLPPGCFFYTRCPVRIDVCRSAPVPLVQGTLAAGHESRCLRHHAAHATTNV